MIVIGTQFYPAEPGAAGRQARCRAAVLALDDAVPVNLQFAAETYQADGFRTLSVLQQDSRTVSGVDGVRKPIMSEMFDALAGIARAEGARYFVFLNNDIQITPAAIETVLSRGLDAYAFSRMDLDPATGAELEVQIFGIDMFAVDAAWWIRERRRFRPYIAGEGCWDNVYASISCAHGRSALVNDRPGIFHERHPTLWKDSPFTGYNGYLATLDAPYFSRWCHYTARVDEARKAGAAVDPRLANEIMGDARLSPAETVRHAARLLRARVRHALGRAG